MKRYEEIDGWFGPEDAKAYDYIISNSKSNAAIVEVGSHLGRSSAYLVDNKKHNQTVVCVDIWEQEELFASFKENMGDRDYQAVRKPSVEAAEWYADESLDAVFIDANHTYESVKEDIAAWYPKVKKGGYIAGHDYFAEPHPGVKKAVDEAMGGKLITPGKFGSCWLARKNSITIVTACSRPENLLTIQESIPEYCDWIVVYDKGVTPAKWHHMGISCDVNAKILFSDEKGVLGFNCLNKGLDHVDTEWVYILDDDNIIHPKWAKYMDHYLENCPEEVIIVCWGQVNVHGRIRLNPKPPELKEIDMASFIVRHSDKRFRNMAYDDDGHFALEHKPGQVVNDYWCYYNYLR